MLSSEDFVDIRIPPSSGKQSKFPHAVSYSDTSSGQRRAFIQFHSVGDATKFLDRYFPELSVELPARDGAASVTTSLYLHFARPRDDGDKKHPADEQWACPSVSRRRNHLQEMSMLRLSSATFRTLRPEPAARCADILSRVRADEVQSGIEGIN